MSSELIADGIRLTQSEVDQINKFSQNVLSASFPHAVGQEETIAIVEIGRFGKSLVSAFELATQIGLPTAAATPGAECDWSSADLACDFPYLTDFETDPHDGVVGDEGELNY